MSTYEAVKYNFNGSGLTNIVSIEVGTILPWSNSTLPSGYLNCDGSAVSRSTYAALFAVIATDCGVGNGSSTFNLPDLQDKVPVGVSGSKAVASSGGSATATPAGSITIGAITPAGNLSMSSITPSGNVGGSTGNTTISQSNMPSHQHRNNAGHPNTNTNDTAGSDGARNIYGNTTFGRLQLLGTLTGGGGAHSHNMSANFSGSAVTPSGNFSGTSVTPSGSFSGSSLSTLQPYVAIKFMIKI